MIGGCSRAAPPNSLQLPELAQAQLWCTELARVQLNSAQLNSPATLDGSSHAHDSIRLHLRLRFVYAYNINVTYWTDCRLGDSLSAPYWYPLEVGPFQRPLSHPQKGRCPVVR